MQLASSSSTPRLPILSSALAYELDMFIFIVIFAFALFNLPRALVYIANNPSELFQGYLLRSSTRFRMYRFSPGTPLQSKEQKLLDYYIPAPESTAPLKQLWHFPMHFSFRHPAAGFLQYRLLGNYTLLQVFLMAGYAAAVFCAAFYKSNPFSNPFRAGWVVTSQIPFVYAFATKNNVIGLLVGVGYEKLNYLHRHIGRLMVVGANVHALGYVYRWSIAGNLSQRISEPYILWGVAALLCFDLLGFFSIHSIRTKSYNLFFGTHVVGFIVVLLAAIYHQQACVPYVLAGSAVYGLDHIVRAIKTRFTTATLRTFPQLGLTRVDIPSLRTGWRAGQHVRLRVLSTSMGFFGMTEVHPFTISSATNTEEGLVLMCKKTGNWTRKLYEMAETTGSGYMFGRKTKVMVEGPYGGIGDVTIPNYSGTMFVVGGSGVTFALSAVQDLVLTSNGSRTNLKVIEVIWCISNPAALEDFIPLFAALVSQSSPIRLWVSVFYTRAACPSFEGFALPSGISLTPGRPNIVRLLDGMVTFMMSKGTSARGAFVAVCGPAGLSRDVADAVRTYDANWKKAIGGMQFHEEVFGW